MFQDIPAPLEEEVQKNLEDDKSEEKKKEVSINLHVYYGMDSNQNQKKKNEIFLLVLYVTCELLAQWN